jgi:hypothetical protein
MTFSGRRVYKFQITSHGITSPHRKNFKDRNLLPIVLVIQASAIIIVPMPHIVFLAIAILHLTDFYAIEEYYIA